MQFIGTINEGKFHPMDPIGYGIFKHKLEGKKVVMELQKKRKPTTNDQYGYLFGREGIFEAVSKQSGHTKIEIEMLYKMRFHFKVIDWYDLAVRIPDSISREKCNRPILSGLIENIRMDATQNDIWTPEPMQK